MGATKKLHLNLLVIKLLTLAVEASKIPKISLDQLKHVDLDAAKTTYGHNLEALIVTDLSENYQLALDSLIQDAPECLTGLQHLPKTRMSDGSERTTYATEDATFPSCLNMMSHLTETFDEVEQAVSALVQKAHGGDKELGYLAGNGDDMTLLKDAPVKDHVHVYQKSPESTTPDNEVMVPYHTDNGLFLILTPFPDVGLKVKLSNGIEVQTSEEVEPRSVLVLMGRGLTHWLLQEGGFSGSATAIQAGEHAVPALSGSVTKRSVYARMKVAPGEAIPASLVKKQGSDRVKALKTFNEVFMEKVASTYSGNDLCSVKLQQSGEVTANKDAWFKAMDNLCEEGKAYCWMGCMSVPQKCAGHPDEMKCYNDKNNNSCRTSPDGKGMDPGCKWHCLEDHQQRNNGQTGNVSWPLFASGIALLMQNN